MSKELHIITDYFADINPFVLWLAVAFAIGIVIYLVGATAHKYSIKKNVIDYLSAPKKNEVILCFILALILTSCIDSSDYVINSEGSQIFKDASFQRINIPWIIELIGLIFFAVVHTMSYVTLRRAKKKNEAKKKDEAKDESKEHDIYNLNVDDLNLIYTVVYVCVVILTGVFTAFAIFMEALDIDWAFVAFLTVQTVFLLLSILSSLIRVDEDLRFMDYNFHLFRYLRPFSKKLSNKFLDSDITDETDDEHKNE